MRVVSLCLLRLTLVGMMCILGPTAQSAESPTIKQVINGLKQYEKAFFDNTSMRMRYERIRTKDPIASIASGGYLLAEWTLIYKEGKWFTERRFTEPKSTKTLEVPKEPMTQIVDGKTILEWIQSDKFAVVDHFKLGRNFYGGLYYTRNMSLDVPKQVASLRNANITELRKAFEDDAALPFLPAFLEENETHYHVSTEPERVDGVDCWVVEWPGMDRFCVDPNRGFVITRRIFNWGPGKPPKWEFRLSDIREVKPGLWIPFKQEELRYASIVAEDKKLWGKVTAESEYKLHELSLNDVSDDVFHVRLPPRTRVMDLIRRFEYSVSANGDGNPFATEIVEAKRQLQSQPVELKKSRSVLWFWLINIVFLIGVAAVILYRSSRRRRS